VAVLDALTTPDARVKVGPTTLGRWTAGALQCSAIRRPHSSSRYAGSSGNLKRRKSEWINTFRDDIFVKGYKVVWHVLTRDWDTSKFGDTPGKLGLKKTRLGAEQIAILRFDAWGRANKYKLYNKINAVGKRNPQYDDILNAGAELEEQQLERNAAAGTGPKDGDELNYGDELPGEAVGGLPGGGGTWKCI
jgi:hypothetical protein